MTATNIESDGRHDFDFVFGRRRLRIRKLADVMDRTCTEWVELDAISEIRPILGGLGNFDTIVSVGLPEADYFESAALRLFDPTTGFWRIWFFTSRQPGVMDDSPVEGRFVDGRGQFFADEVIGGLVGRVLSGDLGTRRFVLTGLGESARESIEAVMKLRKRHCLEVLADGRVNVLGPISSAHEETLEFVTERGEVAVTDVAGRFWAEPNMTAATNRLNTLAGLGLVLRRLERGGPRGNRYVYASIMSVPANPAIGTTRQPKKGEAEAAPSTRQLTGGRSKRSR